MIQLNFVFSLSPASLNGDQDSERTGRLEVDPGLEPRNLIFLSSMSQNPFLSCLFSIPYFLFLILAL